MPKTPKSTAPIKIKYDLSDFTKDYPIYNNALSIIAGLVEILKYDIETSGKEVIEPFEISLKEYLEDVLSYAGDDVQAFIDELNGDLAQEE